MKLATIMRDKEEKFIPNNSTLNRKNSNLFGSVSNKFSENIEIGYNFSLDNDLNTLEYNNIDAIISLNNIVTKFNFIENTDIESETVEADHFMNIVKDCFSDRKVDYIQIDTEGYDYHILKMIDFKNLDISIIKLEFVNLSENEKMKSKTILKENGFYTFVEGIDLIGINLKKVNF